MTAALAAALVLPGPAVAVEDGHSGGGGGGHPTDNTGSLYSDLVVAYRAADGTPILKEYFTEATDEAEATSHFCVQPATFAAVPGLEAEIDRLTGMNTYVLPLQGEWIGDPEPLPVEEIEPCDVQPQYAMFVSEAELERLNLGRTSDDVLQRKLDDVETKFQLGDKITLDAAGRLAVDDAVLDASPEYAAMYSSLMKTGTIPGIAEGTGPASIRQGDLTYGPLELAAVALGTASGKYVPISVDAVQYYNRVVGFLPPMATESPTWAGFPGTVSSEDPKPGQEGVADAEMPTNALPGSEKFLNFNSFRYNRAQHFVGAVTWLEVQTLTWKVSDILDVVKFNDLTPGNEDHAKELTGLTAFAQMADDVRSVIVYLHENEVIPGFYMDPVGIDTTDEQLKRLTSPATDLVLPDGPVFESFPFTLSASLINPARGTAIDHARVRVTVTPRADTQPLPAVTVTASDGQAVPFTDGEESPSLVGWWGPEQGFDVPSLYNVTTAFTATLPDGTAGTYDVVLELVDLDLLQATPEAAVLATDAEVLTVLDDVPTVMWEGDVPEVSTQGAQIPLLLSVYAPADATPAQLRLTVSMDDPATTGADALATGNVRVYGVTASGMVPLTLTLTETGGALTGSWDMTLMRGLNPVAWYFSVVEGAPVGTYSLDVSLADGQDEADVVTIGISAPEDHKSPNPPVVVEKIVGDTATIVASSPDRDVAFYEFVLVKDFTHLRKTTSDDGSMTYENLEPGAYKVKVTAVDKAGNRSVTVDVLFDIAGSTGGTTPTTPPTTPTTPTTPPVEGPAEPPAEDPGNQPEEAGPPDTAVVKGPKDNGWVLRHRVTYRLRSNGEGAAYRVRLDGRQLPDCTSSPCTIAGLGAGTHRVSFAAAVGDQVDATPVVRTFTVPRNLERLRFTKQWTFRERARVFADVAETQQRGQVVRTRARNIKRIALVASKGAGHGTVKVFLGQRLLERISLENASAQRRVMVQVRTFKAAQRGLVRVVVVSDGKPVRLHGIGIATR